MGLFSAPNPIEWITALKDDKLERSIAQTGISILYSQYITFLFEFGSALKGRKYLGFLGDVFIRMAASAFKLLQLQDTEKIIYLSIPMKLVQDRALIDSIWWEKSENK